MGGEKSFKVAGCLVVGVGESTWEFTKQNLFVTADRILFFVDCSFDWHFYRLEKSYKSLSPKSLS